MNQGAKRKLPMFPFLPNVRAGPAGGGALPHWQCTVVLQAESVPTICDRTDQPIGNHSRTGLAGPRRQPDSSDGPPSRQQQATQLSVAVRDETDTEDRDGLQSLPIPQPTAAGLQAASQVNGTLTHEERSADFNFDPHRRSLRRNGLKRCHTSTIEVVIARRHNFLMAQSLHQIMFVVRMNDGKGIEFGLEPNFLIVSILSENYLRKFHRESHHRRNRIPPVQSVWGTDDHKRQNPRLQKRLQPKVYGASSVQNG